MRFHVPFLESDKLVKITKNGHTLLHYRPNTTERYDVKNYRAVVYDESKKVVAFTPPKMVQLEEFMDRVPIEKATIREYVDGTMVYAFHSNGEWHFGTRSTLDAETTYRCGLYPPDGVAPLAPIKRVPKLVELLKPDMEALLPKMEVGNTYVFSFLHPDAFNTVKGTGLYLVAVYRCVDVDEVESLPLPEEGFLTAPLVAASSYMELRTNVCNAPWMFKGVVMTDVETGISAKLIGPNFSYNHKLWVNPSVNRTLVHWFRTSSIKLGDLLNHYPEYETNLAHIKTALAEYGKFLFDCYVECFMQKKKLMREYDKTTRHHLYQLHGVYLNDLRHEMKKVTRSIVLDYVEKLRKEDMILLF
jgi:hypothetical protein